jgi:hypothetical protein
MTRAENLNALFIEDGVIQSERLSKLNKVAIKQMTLLERIDNKNLLQ